MKAPHASHWFARTDDGDTPRCDLCGVRASSVAGGEPCPANPPEVQA